MCGGESHCSCWIFQGGNEGAGEGEISSIVATYVGFVLGKSQKSMRFLAYYIYIYIYISTWNLNISKKVYRFSTSLSSKFSL